MMTMAEILTEIREQRIELEIYQELHKWIMADRKAWINKTMEAESTIRTIGKIAYGNKNKTEALKGIQDICMDDYNKLMDRQMNK